MNLFRRFSLIALAALVPTLVAAQSLPERIARPV
jgi:hypothetical protein